MSDKISLKIILLSVVLTLFSSCIDVDHGGQQSATQASESLNETPELPKIRGAICEPEPDYPDMCEWAASMDAIAWATIENVGFSNQWRPTYSSSDVIDKCERGTPAIELEVSVEKIIFGALPSTVVVSIGGDITASWTVSPKKNGSEPITWRGLDSLEAGLNPEHNSPLVEGQVVGLALHYDEQSERWATLGERLFVTKESQETGTTTIHFQQTIDENDCGHGRAVPVEYQGVEASLFEDSVSGCEENEAASHRNAQVEAAFGKTAMAFAGRCWSNDPPDESVECRTHDDCGSEQLCVGTACSG